VRGGAKSVPLSFFASLVSAGQKPAEQRADSLVAATPSGDVGERSDGLVLEEQSSAKPYLRFGPGTLPLLGALPFAGRSYFKGARSLELGERFSKAFRSASDDSGCSSHDKEGNQALIFISKGAAVLRLFGSAHVARKTEVSNGSRRSGSNVVVRPRLTP